jgi:hypothetical protein
MSKWKPVKPLQPRSAPRDLPGGHWYYANDRSVDIVVSNGENDTAILHLREPHLRKMLSELKPKRKQ